MPGDTPNMGGLRVQTMKRFRPASTLPMLGSSSSKNMSGGGAPYSPPAYYDDMSFSPSSPSHFTYAPLPPPPTGIYSQQLSYPYTNSMNSVPVPFSERRMASQLQQSVTRAAANKYHHQPPPPQPQHVYQAPQQHQYHQAAPSAYPFSPSSIQHQQPQQHHQSYSQPAWKDSLQPNSPGIRMGGGNGGSVASPKSPKVVNLQYNTPIGLYSRENIKFEHILILSMQFQLMKMEILLAVVVKRAK